MEFTEGSDDLALLSDLTEEKLLGALQIRESAGRVYTFIGDILIALNPLRDLPIYGPEVSDAYSSQPIKSLPPHIFAVADRAYQNLQANQTIVIR
ncbi:unconventional myosin-Ia-like [Pyxicephalus adspersus]|uniref:unconventional myosin-Ia-like n=1 Tax=Pyxicephalus adspersus TaxID=30357 RepID=UPI003B5B01AA